MASLPDRAQGAAVQVSHLTKRYESPAGAVTALQDLTIEIAAGAMVALMGPSGSGKSTLLNLIGGMDAATSGLISVGEWAVTELRGRQQALYRQHIGFVFQRFHLLPALTAVDNVAVPLVPRNVDFDVHARASELLASVGLASREQAFPAELSGGEQQRVAIARALINSPVLLLADEPTGNLDSTTGAEVMDLLVRLRAQFQMTVIVATHDPLIASRCQRIVRLRDGVFVDSVEVSPAYPEATLSRIARPGM